MVQNSNDKHYYTDLIVKDRADEQRLIQPWAAYVVLAVKGFQEVTLIKDIAGADYLHLSQCAVECINGHENTELRLGLPCAPGES